MTDHVALDNLCGSSFLEGTDSPLSIHSPSVALHIGVKQCGGMMVLTIDIFYYIDLFVYIVNKLCACMCVCMASSMCEDVHECVEARGQPHTFFFTGYPCCFLRQGLFLV